MRQEILIGPERRRRWSVDEKLAIVREADCPGARVSDVARKHDITRQHIYQWRSALRVGRLVDAGTVGFLPVEVTQEGEGGFEGRKAAEREVLSVDLPIEILLAKGRVLRAPASV